MCVSKRRRGPKEPRGQGCVGGFSPEIERGWLRALTAYDAVLKFLLHASPWEAADGAYVRKVLVEESRAAKKVDDSDELSRWDEAV